MRRWEYHRTRSKVALLLLINLVALLGGKYTALITMVKIELFGEAIAFAKVPKKKALKPHLPVARSDHPESTPRGQPPGHSTIIHVIRPGETLSDIAAAYGYSVEQLRQANRLRNVHRVKVGETLRIPAAVDSRTQLTAKRQVTPSERALLLDLQHYFHPPAAGPATASARMRWPVEGQVTSPFGERDHVMGGGGTQFHAGLDISVPTGTPVHAAHEGIVVFANYNGAYGKAVKLDHAHGLSTLYAHNSRLLVYVGQHVKTGQVISLSGSTGRSTGPHVHFEVQKDGSPVDPLPYLK